VDVITPTQGLTQTVGLWISAGGTDVGTYAISFIDGMKTLGLLIALSLGLFLGIRVFPL
jgi:hypothetical protein